MFLQNIYHTWYIYDANEALDEIFRDMDGEGDGLRMFRLLQGDVGSGKTAVAFLGMLKAAEQGSQSCMLAPTEVLTVQHLQVHAWVDGWVLPISDTCNYFCRWEKK